MSGCDDAIKIADDAAVALDTGPPRDLPVQAEASSDLPAAVDAAGPPVPIHLIVSNHTAPSQPVANVALDLFEATDLATSLASAVSDASGLLTLTLASKPVAAAFRAKATGYRDTYQYVPYGPGGGLEGMAVLEKGGACMDAVIVTQATWSALHGAASPSPGKGLIVGRVYDPAQGFHCPTSCQGCPVAGGPACKAPICSGAWSNGAAITSSNGGSVTYLDAATGQPNPTLSTTDAGGWFTVVNAPPGTTTIKATAGSKSGTLDVTVFAGSVHLGHVAVK